MIQSKLIDTLSSLIRINSVNPAYPQGRPETESQRFILDFFEQRGIPVQTQRVVPGRFNVIAKLAGSSSSPPLVFEAHSDTAGVEGMTIAPFEPVIRDGRMYGRGSCDTKAGLAAMMHALADLRQSGIKPPRPIWVVAAVDEEHAYRGVTKLCEKLKASAAVVSEPTEMKVAIASKGCIRWRITVRGRAAHSSKPELGVNAIYRMRRVLEALELEETTMERVQHPLVGRPTLNVGLIQGGTQVNAVPNLCWIEVDRRLVPGEQPQEVFDLYTGVLEKCRDTCDDFTVHMEAPALQDWPLETPADAGIVRRAVQALKEMGLDSRPVGVAFGSDASKFSRAGIPSVILGPGSIDQAHTSEEYVEIEQVEMAFAVYRRLMNHAD